jgi:hypothetical protein
MLLNPWSKIPTAVVSCLDHRTRRLLILKLLVSFGRNLNIPASVAVASSLLFLELEDSC